MSYRKQYTAGMALKRLFGKKKYFALAKSFVGEPASADEYNEPIVLKKQKGRDFIIVNFTDMHYSDYGPKMRYSYEAARTMRKVVREYHPDLITVTGDLVCDDSTYFSIHRLIDLMESFKTPWAPVFGNHDDEGCDQNYLAREMMKAPHCLLRMGPSVDGIGNYVIAVANEDGPVETLLMMDSHHSQPRLDQTQRAAAEAVKIGAKETAAFMHIPLPDYRTVYDLAWTEGNVWRDGYNAHGVNYETVCCEYDAEGKPHDIGVLDTFLTVPGFKHVICGHEHVNNWSATYRGVELTYTLKVGRASGYRREMNGGTVITVTDEGIANIYDRYIKRIGK